MASVCAAPTFLWLVLAWFCVNTCLVSSEPASSVLSVTSLPRAIEANEWFDEKVAHLSTRFDSILTDVSSKWKHRITSILQSSLPAAVTASTPDIQSRGGSHVTPERRDGRVSPVNVDDYLWHSYEPGTGAANRQQLVVDGLHSTAVLNVSTAAGTHSAHWQLVQGEGVSFLLALYLVGASYRLHIIKTDALKVLDQRIVELDAAGVLVTGVMTHLSATQPRLIVFVKQSVERHIHVFGRSYDKQQEQGRRSYSEEILCFSVDQQTLDTHEVCAPVTVATQSEVIELVTGTVYDPPASADSSGGHSVLLVTLLRSSPTLLIHRLSPLSSLHRQTFSLSLWLSVETGCDEVTTVQLFSLTDTTLLITACRVSTTQELRVYRYDWSSFNVVQRVSLTSAVIDLKAFDIGFQWYLAIAQEDSVTLYTWRVDEFITLQHDISDIAYKWITVPVPTCRDEVILAKVYNDDVDDGRGDDDRVLFYIHNVHTGRFEKVDIVGCWSNEGQWRGRVSVSHCLLTAGVPLLYASSMMPAHTAHHSFLLIPSQTGGLVSVRLDVSAEQVIDPLTLQHRQYTLQLQQLQSRYDDVVGQLDRIGQVLSDVVVPGSDQMLSGYFHFSSSLQAYGVSAPTANVDQVMMSGFSADLGTVVQTSSQLAADVRHVQATVQHFQQQLQDVVYKHAAARFDAVKWFEKPVHVDTVFGMQHVQLDIVNEVHLDSALTDIVTTSSPDIIESTKTVASGVLVVDSLHMQQLNSRPPHTILTTDTPQIITGAVRFSQPLHVTSLTLHSTVNQLDLGQVLLLPYSSTDSPLLNVSVHVDELVADSVDVQVLNGAAPSDLFNVLLNNDEQAAQFTGSVTFQHLNVVNQTTVLGDLNGAAVDSLFSSVLFTDTALSLLSVTVSSVRVQRHLSAGTVNNAVFPGSRYLLAHTTNVTLTAHKWLSCVTARRLDVATLNSLPLHKLVTLDTKQSLFNLHVQSVHFAAGLDVSGSVNDVSVVAQPHSLSQLLSVSRRLPQVTLLFTGAEVQFTTGFLSPFVNDHASLHELFASVVRRTDTEITVRVRGSLVFSRPAWINELHVAGLLGSVRPDHVLTLDSRQQITGHVVFDTVDVSRANIQQLDGVNVTQLLDSVLFVDSPLQQVVTAPLVTFLHNIDLLQARVEGSINLIDADHVLWTHGAQTLLGSHVFTSHVHVHRLHVTGGLEVPDNATVAALDFSALTTRTGGTGTGGAGGEFPWTVRLRQLNVGGAVSADRINGINVRELLARLTGSSQPAVTVTGRWRLRRLHVHGSVFTQQQVLAELAARAVSLNGSSHLTAPLSFSRLLVKSGGRVNSERVLLSGVLWSQLTDSLVNTQHPVTFINVSKYFGGGVHVSGSVFSRSLPLHQLVTLTGSSAEQITGDVIIHSDVTVFPSLTVSSAINDEFDVELVDQLFVSQLSSSSSASATLDIHGNLRLLGDLRAQLLHVHGLTAGYNVTSLVSDAVTLNSTDDVTLSGRLTFVTSQTAGSVRLLDDQLNGRDLSSYLATVRRTDAPTHVVDSPAVFVKELATSELLVTNISVLGLLNNHNITSLLQTVVSLRDNLASSSRWRVSSLVVEHTLHVNTINQAACSSLLQLPLTTDLLHVRASVTSLGHVVTSTGARLNARDISTLHASLVKLCDGESVIIAGSSKILAGHVTITGSLDIGGMLPGGVNLSSVTGTSSGGLHHVSTISGNLIFADGISTDVLVLDATVNDVNASQCATNAVFAHEDAVLQGYYQLFNVSTDVSNSDVITDVSNTIWQQHRQYRQIFSDFKANFTRQCLMLGETYSRIGNTYRAVRYFDIVQNLDWQLYGPIISILVIEQEGLVAEVRAAVLHVLVTHTRTSDGCVSTSVLRWTPLSKPLRLTTFSATSSTSSSAGHVHVWRQMRHNGLIVSAATRCSPTLHCARSALSSVWKWSNGQLQLVQDLLMEATDVVLQPDSSSFYLLNQALNIYRRFHYQNSTGLFIGQQTTTGAALLSVGLLRDRGLLLATAVNDTVSVSHVTAPTLTPSGHVTPLRPLSASALRVFSLRHRVFLAVADAGWSSLVNRPQGVKIFEYVSSLDHRCVPVQHLAAVQPSHVQLVTVGSLPDRLLVVVERNLGLRVFIDNGEAGFVEFQRLSVAGATAVSVFTVNASTRHHTGMSSGLHLLVTTSSRLVLLKAHMAGSELVRFNPQQCVPASHPHDFSATYGDV